MRTWTKFQIFRVGAAAAHAVTAGVNVDMDEKYRKQTAPK
jgi:hypothetical protein